MNSIMSYEYRWHMAAGNSRIGRLNAALLSGYHFVGLKRDVSSSAGWRALDPSGVCNHTFSNFESFKKIIDVDPGSALVHSCRRRQFVCWRRQVLANASLDSPTVDTKKKRVVFLGTPEVCLLFDRLHSCG